MLSMLISLSFEALYKLIAVCLKSDPVLALPPPFPKPLGKHRRGRLEKYLAFFSFVGAGLYFGCSWLPI
jgi:hypothetical protein